MKVNLNVIVTVPGHQPREFTYEFDKELIRIGRDNGNEIQIPLSTVSRNHAVLLLKHGEWFLEDLKSTHGTKHNGRIIEAGSKKLLREGDVIEFVHVRMVFHSAPLSVDPVDAEHTAAIARRVVEEVLACIGNDSDRPYLMVMNGPEQGRRFALGVDMSEVTIGRGSDCEFQINDVNISRRHALVRRDWNDITIEDAGSKNGVIINEKRIRRPTPLQDADEILLGGVRLTFIDPSAKFLGKLDDIPALASATSGFDTNGDDESGAMAPVGSMDSNVSTGFGDEAAVGGAQAYSGVDEQVQASPEAFAEFMPPEQGLPFPDVALPRMQRRLGFIDATLISVALVVVVGLALGIYLLFFLE